MGTAVNALPDPDSPLRCSRPGLGNDEMPREPLETLEPTLDGTLRRATSRKALPDNIIMQEMSLYPNAGDTDSSSPRRSSPIASPAVGRAMLSARFRADRAIVAMAQREISWHGPELWLVCGKCADVKLGPPLRDLSTSEERALAQVQRMVGTSEPPLSKLLVVSDGCIVGPWLPSELRQSKEHVVCISQDAMSRGETLPALCTEELMGVLAKYAKRRLGGPQAADDEVARRRAVPAQPALLEENDYYEGNAKEDDLEGAAESPWADHSDEAWSDGDEYEPSASLVAMDNGGEDEMERAPSLQMNERKLSMNAEAEDDDAFLSQGEGDEIVWPEDENGEASQRDSLELAGEEHASLDAFETVVDPKTHDSVPRMNAGDEPAEGIISADQFVRVARNAWLKTKEPRKQGKDQEAICSAIQHIVLRQEGTDLRKLTTSMIHEEMTANAGKISGEADLSFRVPPLRSQAPTSPVPPSREEQQQQQQQPARGRWGQNQPVVPPLSRTARTQPPANARTRAVTSCRFSSAEEGGPAGLLASPEHMQRLEQLRTRTSHARAVWQTSGAAEALRATMKFDDAALSMSMLHATSDWQPNLQAAECAIALSLARPLLNSCATNPPFAPITTILRTARDRARAPDDTGAPGSSATLTAAKASLVREVRTISHQLEQIRVPRAGELKPGSAGRSASFEEQFAFGQALALTRDAAREAWRALDSEGEAAAQSASAARPTEQVVISSSAVRPAQGSGRRAW